MLSIQIMHLRTQHNLTQAQLAKELCISTSTLGMYEQGRRIPGLDIPVKLSDYFHVSLDYLIAGSDSLKAAHLHLSQACPCSTCYWKEYGK